MRNIALSLKRGDRPVKEIAVGYLTKFYENPADVYDQLVEEHVPQKGGKLKILMDDEGDFFNMFCQPLGDAPEEEEEEEEDNEDEEPIEALPYVEKDGVFICLAEGCDKKLKSKKGILAHIERDH